MALHQSHVVTPFGKGQDSPSYLTTPCYHPLYEGQGVSSRSTLSACPQPSRLRPEHGYLAIATLKAGGTVHPRMEYAVGYPMEAFSL